ncbi:MAG: NUDIX hydrolase [Bacteroidales bacterium]|jgi:8-oxo-dGTP pyrophosphatase MutT (NUDIX family)
MNLEIIQKLKKKLSQPLPGMSAQIKLAPKSLEKELLSGKALKNPRPSAVMIMLYPENGSIHFPVILRNVYNGAHSGQIGLPGGRCESCDLSKYDTAKRETLEEINVSSNEYEYIGALTPLFVLPSNFITHPFVSFSKSKPNFKPDPKEVQEVITVDLLNEINSKKIICKQLKTIRGMSQVPGFEIGEHFIWGATAMILGELIDVIENG